MGGSPARLSQSRGFWDKFSQWIIRIARRGISKHSNQYEGQVYVYAIYRDGRLYKIGTTGGEVAADGSLDRVVSQMRQFRKEKNGEYSFRILRGYANAKSAHAYETLLIQRFSRRFGRRAEKNFADR